MPYINDTLPKDKQTHKRACTYFQWVSLMLILLFQIHKRHRRPRLKYMKHLLASILIVSLCCLSLCPISFDHCFVDIRIIIAPLVSSNSSYQVNGVDGKGLRT